MNPHSPNKLIATEYCFLILGGDYQLLFFISFVILCYFVIINFYKNYFIIIFFMKIIFISSCSGMFRHVPECSLFRGLPTPISKSKVKVS